MFDSRYAELSLNCDVPQSPVLGYSVTCRHSPRFGSHGSRDENWGVAYGKWAEGLIAEVGGDIVNSLSYLEECVDRWRKVERPYELARANRDLARVQEKAGMKAASRESLSAGQKIFSQLRIPG